MEEEKPSFGFETATRQLWDLSADGLAQQLQEELAKESRNRAAIDAIRVTAVDKRVLGKDSDFAKLIGIEVLAEKALADLGDVRFKEGF